MQLKDEATKKLLISMNGKTFEAMSRETGVPVTTIKDFLRKRTYKSWWENFQEDNSVVLNISDLHIPFHHPDAFEFLEYLKQEYSPTRIICLGDEVDQHALNYHEHDPDLYSAGHELEESITYIKQLESIFPKMDILDSNHGSLHHRKRLTAGLPKAYIKSNNDIFEVGPGWSWHRDLTIDLPTGAKCNYHHGRCADVLKSSQQYGMCSVQGHYHEKFDVRYWGNSTGLYWAIQSGCLINDRAYAFNYNNTNLKRPIIGTSVIVGGLPVLEPMILDDHGRWIGC